MNKVFVAIVLSVFLCASNVSAKKRQTVNHCDYDQNTYVEMCYGEDGKLLNGWAVEGNQPDSASKNRRKIRKLMKAKKRGVGDQQQITQELNMATRPYTLSKFRHGKRDGLSRTIDAFEYDIKRVEYKDGRRNGLYEVYYEDHDLQVTATYKDGVLDGNVISYNSRGRRIGKSKYKNGILIKGYCRNANGDREPLPTDGKTIVTEVVPCRDVSNRD